MQLPEEITKQLSARSKMFNDSLCNTCSAHCCRNPGFGIYENSLLIYSLYKEGKLVRKDYVFEPGDNYKTFITKYFDCFTNGVGLTFFYPKVLVNENELLSIPSNGDYPSNRSWTLNNNNWINNHGCIFLEEKIGDEKKLIRCVLHSNEAKEEITTKPIDCVFHGCNVQKCHIPPAPHESSYWFNSLNYFFNKSGEKFDQTNM